MDAAVLRARSATPASLHRHLKCEILLLGVPESDTEKQDLEQYIEKVATALREQNLNARALTTGSGPAHTIVAISETENADLIVLAKSGRDGAHRCADMGSVVSRILELTKRPLLLLDSIKVPANKSA